MNKCSSYITLYKLDLIKTGQDTLKKKGEVLSRWPSLFAVYVFDYLPDQKRVENIK